MNNREKVIKGLQCIVDGTIRCECCGYAIDKHGYYSCQQECAKDAISLLKEQEEDKPKGHWMPYEPDKRGYTNGFTCSRCERIIASDHYCKMLDFDFCPYCGAYMDNDDGR